MHRRSGLPPLWPGESAPAVVGQSIQMMDESGAAAGQPLRVIGLLSAVNESLGNPHPSPHVYVPLGQHQAGAMTLQLRVAAGQDERAMLATVARVMREVDERVPVLRLQTWRARLDASVEDMSSAHWMRGERFTLASPAASAVRGVRRRASAGT